MRSAVRTSLFALPAAASFALLAAPPHADRVLAEVHATYREDATAGRAVAAVCARAIAGTSGSHLELELSPVGAGVEPVPGLDGLPGTNLRAAQELDRLLAGGALRLVTRHDGRSFAGGPTGVERRALPVRTVARDGALGRAHTGGTWPSRVVLRSAALPASGGAVDCWSYVEADGVPRLAVRVRIGAAGARLDVESLGDPADGAAGGGTR